MRAKPVTIHGVEHESLSAAGRALGMLPGSVAYMVKCGRTNCSSRTSGSHWQTPVVIDGTEYWTVDAVAKGLRLSWYKAALIVREYRVREELDQKNS